VDIKYEAPGASRFDEVEMAGLRVTMDDMDSRNARLEEPHISGAYL
jgi:hypothetical protein